MNLLKWILYASERFRRATAEQPEKEFRLAERFSGTLNLGDMRTAGIGDLAIAQKRKNRQEETAIRDLISWHNRN